MVAHQAKELTVFQRTPNFVLPARNHPLTEEQTNDIKSRYDEIWQEARNEIFGMSMVDSKLTMADMKNETQHRRVLEKGWEVGGFRFFFETFADLLTNQRSNDIASDFVRDKIRGVVDDEETYVHSDLDEALQSSLQYSWVARTIRNTNTITLGPKYCVPTTI